VSCSPPRIPLFGALLIPPQDSATVPHPFPRLFRDMGGRMSHCRWAGSTGRCLILVVAPGIRDAVVRRDFDVQSKRTGRLRRGGRAVDGSGLENRHTRKGIGGSNPSLSAITLIINGLLVSLLCPVISFVEIANFSVLTPEEKKMANLTAKLYIRFKAGLCKAPKKPADLPEGSTYCLYWYEDGNKRKAANVGRFADAACGARNNKVAELGNAAIETAKTQPPPPESESKPEPESKPEVNAPVSVRRLWTTSRLLKAASAGMDTVRPPGRCKTTGDGWHTCWSPTAMSTTCCKPPTSSSAPLTSHRVSCSGNGSHLRDQ
jgi:hypothetical protein